MVNGKLGYYPILITKTMDIKIEKYIEEEYLYSVHNDHSYSDTYRGVEYNVIPLKRLRYVKDSIPYYEGIVAELKNETIR